MEAAAAVTGDSFWTGMLSIVGLLLAAASLSFGAVWGSPAFFEGADGLPFDDGENTPALLVAPILVVTDDIFGLSASLVARFIGSIMVPRSLGSRVSVG